MTAVRQRCEATAAAPALLCMLHMLRMLCAMALLCFPPNLN